MDCSWTDIVKIVAGVIAALGGGGAIVAGLSSWLGKVWADRLMVKETAKFREDLERLTKQLERKNYVSKVRFDAEFAIYRELSKTLVIVVQDTSLLFPVGVLQYAPASEQAKKQMYKEYYEDAYKSYTDFSNCLASNSAFIAEDIYQDFESIRKKVCQQVNFYPTIIGMVNTPDLSRKEIEECWSYTAEVYAEQQKLQNKLRKYLKTLDVVDEK